jgi:Putative metal-binding motif
VSTAVRNALGTYGTNASCLDSDGDGFTRFAGDCLEGTAAVSPGAPELAGNSRDDDCNGAVDETPLTESGDFPDDEASAQLVSLPIKIPSR